MDGGRQAPGVGIAVLEAGHVDRPLAGLHPVDGGAQLPQRRQGRPQNRIVDHQAEQDAESGEGHDQPQVLGGVRDQVARQQRPADRPHHDHDRVADQDPMKTDRRRRRAQNSDG
jgi:hypothetical protein